MILAVVLIISFCLSAYAQDNVSKKDSTNSHLNPLLLSSFKKPVKTNPALNEYLKPSKYELMRWPSYPLTASQIEERDKKYDRPFGQQVADEVLGSYINSLLSGKKQTVAVRPKF